MPSITLARLPSAVDPVGVLTPWLKSNSKRSVLWLTSSFTLAEDVRNRIDNPSGHVTVRDLQSFADELVFANDLQAKPLRPRHVRLLATEIAQDDRPVSRADAARLAGTISELKRAGIAEKQWPKELRKALAAWEKARVALGLLDPEDRLRRAAADWAAGKRGPFANVKAVALSGFDAFASPVYELISALVNGADAMALASPERAALPAWVDDDPDPERIEVEAPSPPTVQRIHAPGLLGECRMVARQLREWLDAGIEPSKVVVTCRRPDEMADQLAATFADYGIPFAGLDPPPLSRLPSVSTLLRGWRLPQDGFPFAGVGELLRSSFFNPEWPELTADPDLPLKAEGLLRSLGRPSGKDAFLAAVEQRVVAPLPPLEDEAGDRPRRVRIEVLASYCRPFLQRFFALWDDVPKTAPATKWVERLRAFASERGLENDSALSLFWSECEAWAGSDGPALKVKRLTPDAFTEAVERIAADTPAPTNQHSSNAVRLVAPDVAKNLPCDVLAVIGLGEGSFPDSSAPPSLLADGDRVELASALLPTAESRFDAETKRFADLLARPTKHLVLSRQAVDEKGLELLPSSFLAEWEALNPEWLPPIKQKMTIEGYADGPAYSAAERRVQAARALKQNPNAELSDGRLSPNLLAALKRSQLIAGRRFYETAFTEFDGKLTHHAAVAAVRNRFTPTRPISPSALETYRDCPFKFWLDRVLRIEPLEEPTDEVEFTRRGQAVHRALARYHADVKQGTKNADLHNYISEATDEYGERAGTPFGRILWQLEGRRLQRSAAKYAAQWDDFKGDWAKANAVPSPARFEQTFGGTESSVPPLVIDVGGVSVTIAGTVDRIDTVELDGERGFWVIDYKTGRAANYTGTDVERFNAVQLPLYALAVERTVFADRPSRPLGLAYWMMTDGGAKPVLTGKPVTKWLTDADAWPKFRGQLETWVANLVAHVRMGMFPLAPRKDDCTSTCPFGPTCRIAQGRSVGKKFDLALSGT